MLACSGTVDVAPQQNETPPHVVCLCRNQSQTSGFRVRLGFGVFRCSPSLGDALGQDCTQQVVSTLSVRRHATIRRGELREAVTKRVHTATNTRHEQRFRICASEHDASLLCDESLGLPFVSAFVPPPAWSYDEKSAHSSYHVRCFFGWERTNRCERRPRRHEVLRKRE